jgi:hypothetical protein
LRQTSPGAPTVGTTLLARRVYAGRETNVDCRILDWQADRSVTMEILGGPTRRAVATYEVESIGDDACRVTYTVDGEMRRGLGWLTPVIPRVGRGPVKAKPDQPGTPARGSGNGHRRRPSRGGQPSGSSLSAAELMQ